MKLWTQNLNDRDKHLFHFRGALKNEINYGNYLSWEFVSGPALKLKYQHGEVHGDQEKSQLVLGLFFFTIYLSFNLPASWYFYQQHIATWDNNRKFELVDGREYGFYFYEWAFVWSWHHKINESSTTDPWWMRQYVRIDDLFLGKPESLQDELLESEDVYFAIGEKEFKFDNIKWTRIRRFRRYIPYVLFNRHGYSLNIKIDKPPMTGGKWGDDGTYGMSCEWKGPTPNWKNRVECEKWVVSIYCANVFDEIRRRGTADGPRAVQKEDVFEYIGQKPVHFEAVASEPR